MIGTIFILIIGFLLWYINPFVDIDSENNQIIIHYSWMGVRKTYIAK